MSDKKWPRTEVELAAPVVEWLQDQHWDVYQEVNAYGRTADIVAVRGLLIWVVEVKAALSLAVMDQAFYWRTWAHLSSVAIPYRRRERNDRGYAFRCLGRDGTGLLVVQPPPVSVYAPHGLQRVAEKLAPHLNRRIVSGLRGRLHEAQKTHAPAGSQAGSWTPFVGTCEELRRYVRANPGATLKQTMDAIKHHYHTSATARSSMAKWIQKGIVKGVRFELEGRAIRLYAEGA